MADAEVTSWKHNKPWKSSEWNVTIYLFIYLREGEQEGTWDEGFKALYLCSSVEGLRPSKISKICIGDIGKLIYHKACRETSLL